MNIVINKINLQPDTNTFMLLVRFTSHFFSLPSQDNLLQRKFEMSLPATHNLLLPRIQKSNNIQLRFLFLAFLLRFIDNSTQ